MIKGNNHHVMPDETGWCVIEEANQMVVQHFDTQNEALIYAQASARVCEGEVLVHMTPSEFVTVPLPQRDFLQDKAHGHSPQPL